MLRSDLEQVVIHRCGKLMLAAGLNGTAGGTNPDLTDPLATALRATGYPLRSPVAVSDADVATLASSDVDQVLDRAEVRVLENTLGNLDLVSTEAGPLKQALSDLGKRLETLIATKQKRLEVRYGADAPTLTAGVVDLDFQQRHEYEGTDRYV